VEDEVLLEREPWIEAPIRMDYGFNVRLGEGVFINANCFIIDTCLVTIGARTLFGPNVHLYSGTHPLDPAVRNGTQGPELGKEIHIGEDCWLAGNVTVLPGVTIGKGATIGAGSVVTKVLLLLTLSLSSFPVIMDILDADIVDCLGCSCFPFGCGQSGKSHPED
jgi:acetyltransferase-like isoleucine patch superfamily enzyme